MGFSSRASRALKLGLGNYVHGLSCPEICGLFPDQGLREMRIKTQLRLRRKGGKERSQDRKQENSGWSGWNIYDYGIHEGGRMSQEALK